MRSLYFYVISCVLAGAVPCVKWERGNNPVPGPFPGWPACFEGKTIRELPLSVREQKLIDGFPGRVSRFTDGEREVIMRWVTEETRKLHPASDCFRGLGYSIRPLPLRTDQQGRHWGCFEALRGNEKIFVRERIYDAGNGSWSDVSEWYWAALLGRTTGPWWAVTVAEIHRP